MMRSAADQDFIDSLPTRDVIAFRSSIYTSAYIAANAEDFLSNDWIKPDQLRKFLKQTGLNRESTAADSPPARVKLESDASLAPLSAGERATPLTDCPAIKIRALKEGDREVLEILSDSESESESPSAPADDFEIDESASMAPSELESESTFIETDFDEIHSLSDEPETTNELQESDTFWMDDGMSSQVRVGRFRVTNSVTVQRVEYLNWLPSILPIPEITTAFVVDLHDPKFNITDSDGQLYTVDALIKNKDNDSWIGGTGRADSHVMVSFEPDEPPILCRRSRIDCKGSFACERVDPALLDVERRDLNPATRDAVFAAQRQTRRQEGTSPEQRVTEFLQIVRGHKCTARQANGEKCNGIAVLKTKKQKSRGHDHWLGCSGWKPDSTASDPKNKHRSLAIPDNVDQALFLAALNGQPLVTDNSKDTGACSAIVHPTTGLKRKYCPHTHIVNGKPVTNSLIVKRSCNASRTIFVPVDETIRKALIIHKRDTPHNHPMPAFTKVSLELKASYRQCIQAAGCVGATVAKVDNASSTKVLLGGKRPGEFAPALQSNVAKQKLVREEKLKAYPQGLGVPGAFQLFFDDLKKGIDERYIQRIAVEKDGGTIILTCLAALMRLLDDEGVTSFETDTTFRRVAGDFNEWEVVIFLKALQRAVTIARAYVNGASTDFFERLYDKFQEVKMDLTNKPVAFKRFVKGGNILAMNSDMEGAQVLGAARSFSKLNKDEEYSKLATDTPPEKVAPEIIKLCTTHGKRGVLELKPLVSESDFQRLMDFIYIDSPEGIEEMSEFVRSLGIQKIQDWWDHKALSAWILPCLVKSQSPMSADNWENTPATTNTGEGQHAWTNSHTGTGLTLVEAIESARKLDEEVARDIEIAINSGVLRNSNNESSHRRARNTTRASTTMRKAHEANEVEEERARLAAKMASIQESRKELATEYKALKTLHSATRKGGKGSKATPTMRRVVVSASSSGRVKTRTIASSKPVSPAQPIPSTSMAPENDLQTPAYGLTTPAYEASDSVSYGAENILFGLNSAVHSFSYGFI
ncbi:hypothetical protein C8R43DRAFT_310073 [Mycena crocata]|nr:hypothetical protein C8R43DRAFT_310073 [Mycena crocata]